MDKAEKTSGSHHTPALAGHDSVPALEVPLGNLQNQEDELLSWLQYPLEDSFDKNYCSKELSMEAPSFVHDAFSNLTLREGEKLRSTGLRSQNSLPSDLTLRERECAGNARMASRTWGVAAAHDTNRERVQAANTAMAIGAHRAAGLLFQSGAETFNKVRTNAQRHFLTGAQNLATPESDRSESMAFPRTSKGGDEESRFQHSARCLTSPNFPLFSRAVSGSWQDKLGASAQGRDRDFALKGEQKASVASPTYHAQPALLPLGTSSEGLGASIITKNASACFPQSSTAKMREMLFPSVPFQCKNNWQPSTARTKEEAVSTLSIDLTKKSSISHDLGAESLSMIPIEEMLTAQRAEYASIGAPSFSTTASAGLLSGSFVGSSGALPQIETKALYPTFAKENPYSGAKLKFTTDEESSRHSELARHDGEGSRYNKGCGVVYSLKKARLGSGEELDNSSCPVVTVSSPTTSESKVWETLEGEEITMASPSGDSGEKTSKEAPISTMKRKSHFAQDIEMESQNFKGGKLQQGSPSVAKKSRKVEIHNFVEE